VRVLGSTAPGIRTMDWKTFNIRNEILCNISSSHPRSTHSTTHSRSSHTTRWAPQRGRMIGPSCIVGIIGKVHADIRNSHPATSYRPRQLSSSRYHGFRDGAVKSTRPRTNGPRYEWHKWYGNATCVIPQLSTTCLRERSFCMPTTRQPVHRCAVSEFPGTNA
jgi:hypothetical protein